MSRYKYKRPPCARCGTELKATAGLWRCPKCGSSPAHYDKRHIVPRIAGTMVSKLIKDEEND